LVGWAKAPVAPCPPLSNLPPRPEIPEINGDHHEPGEQRRHRTGSLEGIGGGKDPADIAALFDERMVFEIQGDDGVLPWIGRKTGRSAIADFVRDVRAMTEPVSFEVEDILASESRAAIVGALETRVKATGKLIRSQFAIILTVSGDLVTRYQMLEDSFDVSKAARL
jgi:ketosteroid isomerase-like protein